MARRFNQQEQRKTPKPSSNERTWSRFRIRHDIETVQDKERIGRLEQAKIKGMEALKGKARQIKVTKGEFLSYLHGIGRK